MSGSTRAATPRSPSCATAGPSGWDVQIVISDGLNALALIDEGHLAPYLERLRGDLDAAGYELAPEPIVVTGGRVRAGYRIGEILYGARSDAAARPAIVHVIGERPGSGHHAYSVYITAAPVSVWAEAGRADHNITRVVSGDRRHGVAARARGGGDGEDPERTRSRRVMAPRARDRRSSRARFVATVPAARSGACRDRSHTSEEVSWPRPLALCPRNRLRRRCSGARQEEDQPSGLGPGGLPRAVRDRRHHLRRSPRSSSPRRRRTSSRTWPRTR